MNLPLQNRVILVLAGEEDRDAEIIQVLQAEGAVPCFILKDPVYCVRMVKEMIRRYGRIDGVVNSLGDNDHSGGYARLVVQTVKPLLKVSGGSIVNLVSMDRDITRTVIFLLSPAPQGTAATRP